MPETDDLGPFRPPPGYEFEEELRGEPPRDRTAELKSGRFAVGRRKLVSGLLIAAAICTAFAPLPFVQEIGLYFVPLEYLLWIGIALGVTAILQLAYDWAFPGPFRYVERGIPLIVRIRGVDLRVSRTINDVPYHRFHAQLDFRDPETGEIRQAETQTREFALYALKRGLSTTYQVGDYATAVYLPGKLEKSFRLYGFLELKPGLGLIEDRAAREWSLRSLIVGCAAGFGVLFFALWHVYAVSKYWPLEIDPAGGCVAFFGGSVVLGVAFFAWIAARKKRLEASEVSEPVVAAPRPQGKVASAFGICLLAALGGLAVLVWCSAANALLDRSPAKPRPVQIDRMVSVTHKFVLREYKIEYHFLDGDQEHHSLWSTPREMARFGFRNAVAVARVREGRFGWPWVEAIQPVEEGP